MLFGAALGLWIRLPEHDALNLDPLNRWREPHLALDVKPRSGPIVILIEYIIREENLHDFLDAMAERRRIRRRDGARNWTLMRDLENPAALDRDLSHADLDRICPAQPAHDACRRRRRATSCWRCTAEPSRRSVHRMIERPTDWAASQGQLKGMVDLH